MWNYLFQLAYNDNVSDNTGEKYKYFYQCGDDLVFDQPFLSKCIHLLKKDNDNELGVAGVMCIDNLSILTQTLVSRTHMEIFGYYFPEKIVNWYCDDWINNVYKSINKCFIEKSYQIVNQHQVDVGLQTNRYIPETNHHIYLNELDQTGKILQTYLESNQLQLKSLTRNNANPNPNKIPTGIGICLNMIVKDEAKNMERLLKSVANVIDYYVICDTGSSDTTKEVIATVAENLGLTGEIIDHQWSGFGENRTLAIEASVLALREQRHDCNWILIIDADEQLECKNLDFYQTLDAARSYQINKKIGEFSYPVNNLLNIKYETWKWQGAIHEYSECVSGKGLAGNVQDLTIIVGGCFEGGRCSKFKSVEEKYLADAEVCLRELEKNPNDPRTIFYLAQSYRDGDKPELAIEYYLKRAEMKNTYIQERYIAYFEAAKLLDTSMKEVDRALMYYLRAFNLIPSRAEAPTSYSNLCSWHGQSMSGYLIAKEALTIAKADGGDLFRDNTCLQWRLHDAHFINAWNLQKYREAYKSVKYVLNQHRDGIAKIDQASLSRIQTNERVCKINLKEEWDSQKRKIAFYAGFVYGPINLETMTTSRDAREQDVALLEVCRLLAKNNNYEVVVCFQPIISGVYENVRHLDITEFKKYMKNENSPVDVLVCSRYAHGLIEFPLAKKNYFWMHDLEILPWCQGGQLSVENVLNNLGHRLDGIICMSDFHIKNTKLLYHWKGVTATHHSPFRPPLREQQGNSLRVRDIPPLHEQQGNSLQDRPLLDGEKENSLGVRDRDRPLLKEREDSPRGSASFLFNSLTGLDSVINFFKKIKKVDPSVKLHLYRQTNLKKEFANIDGIINHPNATLLDEIKAMSASQYWISDSSQMLDPSGNGAIEAAMAGCIPIIKPGDAISEVLADYININDIHNKNDITTMLNTDYSDMIERNKALAEERLRGVIHAQADHGPGRQRHAHPPEPVPRRRERLLRPGDGTAALAGRAVLRRGAAAACPRLLRTHQSADQFLQAPGAGLRSAGECRVERAEPLAAGADPRAARGGHPLRAPDAGPVGQSLPLTHRAAGGGPRWRGETDGMPGTGEPQHLPDELPRSAEVPDRRPAARPARGARPVREGRRDQGVARRAPDRAVPGGEA